MNYGEAKKILAQIFNQEEFKEENFKNFIFHFFAKNNPQEPKTRIIDEKYQSHIANCTEIGNYDLNKVNKLTVIIVKLSANKELDRSRTLQRNFIADILRQSHHTSHALVAFVNNDSSNWRFSLVKLDYILDEKNEVREKYSSAKRFSFLLGKNEGFHTAQKQFLKILANEKNAPPTIDEIEQAFNIESVTADFFNEYKELFNRTKETLDNFLNINPTEKKHFADKKISVADFAKKTLGQIVFLYFLQKKGWFAVKDGEPWGSGNKNFLKNYFEENKDKKNFFNDCLEPLFYKALALDRGEKSLFKEIDNLRFPFLNGGLFEPMRDYSWENTNINLPNELFSNEDKTKDDFTGTGILDVFNRYNFTVNENEPLEQEVAVDPEMLGKVFENLLEVVDRKSQGAFYTPRTIVHYMCQEALIQYLATNCDIEIADLTDFIKKDNNEILQKYSPNQLQKIDKLLQDVKICDPAIGSGAFALGILSEIVNARLKLVQGNDCNEYNLKLHTIENSIYGVDLNPSAVDIAKLRLWLALVVEESDPKPLPNLEYKIMQGNSLLQDYEGIKLFDEKIFTTNNNQSDRISELSKKIDNINKQLLIEAQNSKAKSQNPQFLSLQKDQINYKKELEKLNAKDGLELINENNRALYFDFQNVENSNQNQHEKIFIELQLHIKKYFTENRRDQKIELKHKIDQLKWQLIETTLTAQKKLDKLNEIKEHRQSGKSPFFIWQLEFPDIFNSNLANNKNNVAGFDIVIGNPPYICENKEDFSMLKKSKYYMGKANIWYFFGCISLDLLKNNGIKAFIAPNNWTSNFGAKLLRKKILEESKILEFIDFENFKVFENADIQTMIYIIKKCLPTNVYDLKFSKIEDKKIDKIDLKYFLQHDYGDYNYRYRKEILKFEFQKFLGNNINFLNQENDFVINKINNGNKTFLTKIEVAQGVVIPQDLIIKNHIKLAGNYNKGDGIFVISHKEKERLKLSSKEIEILKPYFTTQNFYKFGANPNNNYWLIYTDSKFKNPKEMDIFPNLKKHLDQFKEIITSDNKPYGLHRARDEKFFKGEKILIARKCIEPEFSYCNFDSYVSATFNLIKTDRFNLKFLVAILNSKLIKFWLKNKGKMQGTNFQLDQEPLIKIPIPQIPTTQQQLFIAIVDEILAITNEPDHNPNYPPARQKELEAKIDEMVCDLYELNDEERNLILIPNQYL